MTPVLRSLAFTALIIVFELSSPLPVFALQAHGYKGLYVHQGAHILFLFAMIFFTFQIRWFGFINRKEWKWMSYGAWLLAVWNIWAFTGHVVELFVPDSRIQLLGNDIVPSITIASWKELAYFLMKMDHLLSVPAIICFYIGLRTMINGIEQQS